MEKTSREQQERWRQFRDRSDESFHFRDKLKNESSAKNAAGKKLRHGKAENTKPSAKKTSPIRQISPARRIVDHQMDHEEDDHQNSDGISRRVIDNGETAAAVVANGIKSRAKQNHYQRKHKAYSEKVRKSKRRDDGVSEQSKGAQIRRQQMKKELQRAAQKKSDKEAVNKAGSVSKKFVDKASDMAGKIGEFVAEHVASPKVLIGALVVILLICLIAGLFSVSGLFTGAVNNVSIASSFTAEDDDIRQVEADYKAKEEELQRKIDNIETDYPGYDEYRYNLAEINHNPYQLAALLTVLYEDYTPDEVSAKLQEIFDIQYKLTLTPSTETRTRTNEAGETEEYEVKILTVTLVNNTLQAAVDAENLDADLMERYQLLMETQGNKSYLFGDDIYANPAQGDYQDYQVPTEALTDERFGRMLNEAEKYLGYPYVWGGSSPSTSFDCSGFVCWVINHSGNGWNVGRTTANGLVGKCMKISKEEAKPGDLIFFQGTYATRGASHVGIIVGNGTMIHCGNPIQFASYESSYWRNHYYTCGRIR